jgi:hypothetical protein
MSAIATRRTWRRCSVMFAFGGKVGMRLPWQNVCLTLSGHRHSRCPLMTLSRLLLRDTAINKARSP